MPVDKKQLRRFRDNLQGEVDAASTYRALADLEKNLQLREVYDRMAHIEQRHVELWAAKLREVGVEPVMRPSARARMMQWMARKFGIGFILPTLVSTEQTASHSYDAQPEAKGTGIIGEEQAHARVLQAVSKASPDTGVEGGALARLEGRHRAVGGNALRAAVLGANDGLVSTLSLVMGVAGGSRDAQTVALAGVAGMVAGACAMAMGEWLSVQSARELAQRQLAIEASELEYAPQEEMEELALIYQSKGLPEDAAKNLARKLMENRDTALDTLAREELGIDPAELGGSAWEAAIASFLLFLAGAIAPVVPFLLIESMVSAIVVCLIASAVALVLLGFMTHVLTGRGMWFSGIRQLIIGLLAGAVTFGMGTVVGKLFGIQIAG